MQSLPFSKVEHKVETLDAQPSNEGGGILVMVTGQLLVSKNKTYRARPNTLKIAG